MCVLNSMHDQIIVSNAGIKKENVLCIEEKNLVNEEYFMMYVKKAHVSLNSMMNSFIQNE